MSLPQSRALIRIASWSICSAVLLGTPEPETIISAPVAVLPPPAPAQSRHVRTFYRAASAVEPNSSTTVFLPLIAKSRVRSTVDQPDDTAGHQIHAMYVVPSDGTDRYLDINGVISTSVSAFQTWFIDQSGGTRFRLDTSQDDLDITFVRLPRSNQDIASYGAYVRDQVQVDLHAAGFNDPSKIYAVYYDGLSNWSCGGGAWPPDLAGNVAAMYLLGAFGTVQCSNTPFTTSPLTPGYWDYGMLHEIFHTLGAAPQCAPHHHRRGHTFDDNRDLMYAGDLYWLFPLILDIGRDDYYGHGNPGCLDVARSVFLDPLPANAVKPPGWP